MLQHLLLYQAIFRRGIRKRTLPEGMAGRLFYLQNAFYIQYPEYLAKLSSGDASNIMASFVNMSLYNIMPLMMLKGEEALRGTEEFQAKLSELYMTHLGQPITYEDFLTATGLSKEAIELA